MFSCTCCGVAINTQPSATTRAGVGKGMGWEEVVVVRRGREWDP